MTAIIAPYRLKGKDFASCEGMPFQQHFEARVDRPLDDLDLHEFFRDLQSALRVGDQVTVCAYMDNTWQVLMEVGTCRVIEKDARDKRITGAWIGKPYEVPKPDMEKKSFKAKERKLTIKKEFGGGFTVQDDKGAVIERVKTKKEAEDYVDRLNNIKAPAAEVSSPDGPKIRPEIEARLEN